jgi:arylsulfate sulfotransferase
VRFPISCRKGVLALPPSRLLLCAFTILLLLAALGCGSSSAPAVPYVSAVVATPNPLVAQYSVRQFHPGFTVWVEFGTDTNYGRQTSVISDAVNVTGGSMVNVLVAGMKAETTYHMRAHIDGPGGSFVDQDHTFTTGAIPSNLALPQFTVTRPTANIAGGAAPAPGVEVLSLVNTPTGGVQGVSTDLDGNVIWYCTGEAIPLKPLPNGHFMFMRGNALEEVDLACNSIRRVTKDQVDQSLQAHGYDWPPLDAFHHDMLALPNGHWIGLAQVTKSVTATSGTLDVQGDVLVDIDPTGDVAWAWSSFDPCTPTHPTCLDINRAIFGLPDWTHSNALVYTQDGNLLLSMRGQSWILKIDYANGAGTGNILWRLGNAGDFAIASGDPSQWFYGQHYPKVLSVNGSKSTLSVFDNGNFRIDSSNVACGSSTTAPPCYTRALILQIDEATKIASESWEYRPGFFSYWGGAVTALDNGNVEFDMSEPYNSFDSTGPFNSLQSLIMEVTQTSSPEVVWEMNVTGEHAYRGFRIPSLYPGVTWQK